MKKKLILYLGTAWLFMFLLMGYSAAGATPMNRLGDLQKDTSSQYEVQIKEEKPASAEGEMDAVKSVWLTNKRTGKVFRVCVTNPMAEAQWGKMNGEKSDAVDVPLSQIAAADKAMIVSGDDVKIIVEGCPDGRNIWTYIIDPYTGTAKQLPSSEGVISFDSDKREIIVLHTAMTQTDVTP